MFGFHLGPGGNATGHRDFLAALDAAGIPFICKSADAFPIDAQRIAQASSLPHTVIYRRSLDDAADPCPSGNPDVPDYNKAPRDAAIEHWDWHIRHLPPELDPAVTWLETINEVDKNRSEWLAEFAYHTAVLAIGDGYKWAAFGWSTGEPEPAHWHGPQMQRFLEVCAQYPDRLAVAVHEYSLDKTGIWNGRDGNGKHWLVGRVEHLFAACDSMDIPHPTVLITEWGWTLNDVPEPSQAERDFIEVAQLYAQYPTLRGAALWYLGGGWSGIAQKAQRLIAPLQALFLSGQIPNVPAPPPPPPHPANLIDNGSFEDGWVDVPSGHGWNNQQPTGWLLRWLRPGDPSWELNAKTGSVPTATAVPEVVHKLDWQLPPDEQPGGPRALILDGVAVYKAFTAGDIWGIELEQELTATPGATLTVRVPVQVHYQQVLIEPDDFEVAILLNDHKRRFYAIPDLPDRQWVTLEHSTVVGASGKVRLRIRAYNKWMNGRDIFIDAVGASETAVAPPPPPPDPSPCIGEPREQYARTYWVAPQDVDEATWLELARQAFVEKRTIGFSYDDAGIGALASKTAVLYGIAPSDRGTFADWFWRHYPTARVEFRDLPGQPIRLKYRPCDTSRITQRFGANPQNYPLTPGHEGLDYAVAWGHPFYAAQDGTVVHASDRRWSSPSQPSDYGWHVVLQHDGGFATVYAHAERQLPVKVGDFVPAGAVVGWSGNTGRSDGYHLHFTLMDQTGTIDPGNGYPYWKYGRPVDPEPFLLGLQAPPSSPPSPPPTGQAGIGLHASADPGDLYGGSAEFAEFAALRGDVIKVLSAHSASSITRLAADTPGAQWIVRAFLDFGGRVITPQQFYNDTKPDVLRAVNALRQAGVPDGRIHIELHNEPNLVDEGWRASWANGREFGDWLIALLGLYRPLLPNVRFMYPGLSPGGDIPGVRTASSGFLNDSSHALTFCDDLGVHAYWSQGYPMSQALGHVDAHAPRGKPIWITEASRNDRPVTVPDAQYASEYRLFWQELRKRPLVRGVTYFVASASNPYFHPECWVVNGASRGIAAAIRSAD